MAIYFYGFFFNFHEMFSLSDFFQFDQSSYYYIDHYQPLGTCVRVVMLIFSPVHYLYLIDTYVPSIFEIQWKKIKLCLDIDLSHWWTVGKRLDIPEKSSNFIAGGYNYY